MALIYFVITALIAFILGLMAAALITRFGRANTSAWSPEHIAYNLMGVIAKQEGKSLGGRLDGVRPDRKWLLDTYAECMQAVREPSHRLDIKK